MIVTDRRRVVMAAALGALTPNAFSQAAAAAGRDVIVLIPGITGSVLEVRGREVWAPSAQGLVGALLSLGRSLKSLKLQGDPIDRLSLDDGVVATRLIEDVHLIPGLWKIDGYSKLVASVGALPGVRAQENFFQFPYDWRRDNRVSAARLQTATHDWLKSWRERSGNSDAKLVFLAHSMGGLVARYFVECMEGWKDTRRVITFGTPYRGSVKALRSLHEGVGGVVEKLGLFDLSELTRSFTSVYQLLPTYPCIDDGTSLKRIAEAGAIENVDAVRAAQALTFHRAMDGAVAANRNDTRFMQSPYRLHPVVGVSQDTLQIASQTGRSLTFLSVYSGEAVEGDGTVLRPSATPFEAEGLDTEMFVGDTHGTLQNSDQVVRQVGALMKAGDVQWTRFRSAEPKASLRVPDAVGAFQRIPIEGAIDPGHYSPEVELAIVEIYSGKTVSTVTAVAGDSGAFATTTQGLPAGAYRIRGTFERRVGLEFVERADVICVLPVPT